LESLSLRLFFHSPLSLGLSLFHTAGSAISFFYFGDHFRDPEWSTCKEFAEHQKIEADFRSDGCSVLPPEIGLTLFRVLQEAMHNATKHSGVKRVDVQLREQSGEIHLTVSDTGRGFDIDSKPMTGTTIHVRVPIPSESKRAAG